MPPIAVRMVKEAVDACAGALNRATSFADADQGHLCTLLGENQAAIASSADAAVSAKEGD